MLVIINLVECVFYSIVLKLGAIQLGKFNNYHYTHTFK